MMRAYGTNGGASGEISNYLNRNVEAVVLPDRLRRHGSTNPPLIIDGASGTGKTQQAFALVKEHTNTHKSIIYFLMSQPPQGGWFREQLIYESMRYLTGDVLIRRFAHRVDEAIKALREDKYNKDEDICSLYFLNRQIKGASDELTEYDPESTRWARKDDRAVNGRGLLMDVVLWMCSKRLHYDDGVLLVVAISLEGKKNCEFKDLYVQLEDIILFVDEVMPKSGLSAGDCHLSESDRLRFVRNLGRALKMRVVLAGTGATAANLISERSTSKPENFASRSGPGPVEMAWIEFIFLEANVGE